MVKTGPFEKYYERYEEWFDKHRYAYESELKAINEIFPIFSRGVEIGVGTGRYAAPLGITVGIEPADKPATIALSRGIDVIKGVAENMPFATSSLDLALMVTTICFLDDIEKSFTEVRRILKDGGSFVIGYVDKDSDLGQTYMQRKQENPFYKDANFYGTLELVKLLTDTGFGYFSFRQTIFKRLEEITGPEPVAEGYGKGSFVVVRASLLDHPSHLH